MFREVIFPPIDEVLSITTSLIMGFHLDDRGKKRKKDLFNIKHEKKMRNDLNKRGIIFSLELLAFIVSCTVTNTYTSPSKYANVT